MLACHLEAVGVDHRHLPGEGHADVDALAVGALHPVGARPGNLDARERARRFRERHQRIDDRDARVVVEHRDVVAVQIQHRPQPDDAPHVQRHLVLAGFHFRARLALDVAADVEPRPGVVAAQRLAARLVGELEAQIGELPLHQLAALRLLRRRDAELDDDAFPHVAIRHRGFGGRAFRLGPIGRKRERESRRERTPRPRAFATNLVPFNTHFPLPEKKIIGVQTSSWGLHSRRPHVSCLPPC